MNIFDIAGSVALVTGATRGLGLEISRLYLAHGASVTINGHDAGEVESAVATLRQELRDRAGIRVFGIAGDVSLSETADVLVSKTTEVFGHLDHVVCNAGIDIIRPAQDYTPAEWQKVIAVNLGGAFYIAQRAAQHWIAIRQSGGTISITSSIAGAVGIPTLAPYAASKGGINQLVRTLAVDWAEYGIRVNAVAPGYIDNIMDGVTAHRDPRSEDRIRRFTPLGRRATVTEIAAPFLFLASPAARYITGSVLAVDGGYTAL